VSAPPDDGDGQIPHHKVVVLANSVSGKTVAITRWTVGTFSATSKPTISSSHECKRVTVDGKGPAGFNVCGTAGQE
jgi:hypothetical protein